MGAESTPGIVGATSLSVLSRVLVDDIVEAVKGVAGVAAADATALESTPRLSLAGGARISKSGKSRRSCRNELIVSLPS